jgi:hypothetical protein
MYCYCHVSGDSTVKASVKELKRVWQALGAQTQSAWAEEEQQLQRTGEANEREKEVAQQASHIASSYLKNICQYVELVCTLQVLYRLGL